MTITEIEDMAREIAAKFADSDSVRRGDVIRVVVRTRKLNLDDSLILAHCIIEGLYQAGKSVVVSA